MSDKSKDDLYNEINAYQMEQIRENIIRQVLELIIYVILILFFMYIASRFVSKKIRNNN